MTSYETLWTCDKCKKASFPSFEEAVEHENNCKGEANEESDDEVQIISPPSQSAGKVSSPRPAPSTNDARKKSDTATEEVWTCDYCNVAKFKSYDEAVVHEKSCTGNVKNHNSGKVSKAAEASSQATDELEMETSFICDVCKTAEFSTYEEAAEHEAKCFGTSRKGGGEKNRSNTATTLVEVSTGKRSEGGEQKNLPKQRQEQKGKEVNAVRATVWTCDVCKTAEFPTFEEAAEHEKSCSGSRNGGRKAVPGSEAAVLSPRLENRAGKGSDIASRKSRRSAQKKNALESAASDPAKLIPLISNITSNESMRLSPFNMLAMAQIDLALKKDLDGVGEKYEPRCRHCGATSKVNSLETLYKGIYSMTYSHLLKSCPHIPGSVRESLQNHQRNKKSSASIDRGTLGLRQFCSVLIEKLRLGRSKPVSAGKEIKHQMVGISSEEKSHERQHRKRASESGSSTGLSNRNAKRSKSTKSESKTSVQAAHIFTFEDEDGVKTILPPFGGVPLLSSFVSKLSTYKQLSAYEQFILGQLELAEDPGCSNSPRPLVVRCQNCKIQPSLSNAKPLRSIKRWHKVVEEMGDHCTQCKFLSRPIRESMISAQTSGVRVSGVSGSLETFCSYLTDFLALQETKPRDGSVVWGECPPVKPGYLSPTVYPEKVKSKLPLLTAQSSSTSTSTNLVADASTPLTVSDYAYLLTAQLQLVPIDRKVHMPSLGSNESSLSLRQRSRRRNADGTSRSPSSSGRSTPTNFLEDTLLSSDAIGLRCKHCSLTKPVTSVGDLARSMPHQYYYHFKKCPLFPAALIERLDAVKVLQGIQKSQFVTSLPDYCRQVIDVYGLVDLEWNGASSGVAFRGDKAGIKKMLEADEMMQLVDDEQAQNGSGQESFVLPLLVRKIAKPVTSDLVKIAEGDEGHGSSSLDVSLSAKLPPSEISESGLRLKTSTKDGDEFQMFTPPQKPSEQPMYNQVIDCLWKKQWV